VRTRWQSRSSSKGLVTLLQQRPRHRHRRFTRTTSRSDLDPDNGVSRNKIGETRSQFLVGVGDLYLETCLQTWYPDSVTFQRRISHKCQSTKADIRDAFFELLPSAMFLPTITRWPSVPHVYTRPRPCFGVTEHISKISHKSL
jgi:hypothetical protein